MAESALSGGVLWVVPTPVGNLEDFTLRAIRYLKEADLVLAEDTRVTAFLFQRHGISTSIRSYHQFNEKASCERIAAEIQQGKKVCLVSDAGTPAISDPGQILVAYCLDLGIPVSCLPGPNALLPALVMSGFDTSAFVFLGFLPHKKGRQTALKAIAAESKTQLMYESPHRILKLLAELQQVLEPGRRVALVREISKKFEEMRRGTPEELLKHFADSGVKGEFAVVVEQADKQQRKLARKQMEEV